MQIQKIVKCAVALKDRLELDIRPVLSKRTGASECFAVADSFNAACEADVWLVCVLDRTGAVRPFLPLQVRVKILLAHAPYLADEDATDWPVSLPTGAAEDSKIQPHLDNIFYLDLKSIGLTVRPGRRHKSDRLQVTSQVGEDILVFTTRVPWWYGLALFARAGGGVHAVHVSLRRWW